MAISHLHCRGIKVYNKIHRTSIRTRKDMAYHCFGCGNTVEISSSRPGRGDTCPKCRRDLHACKNCHHYDLAAYNSCRESQAERVVDKERSNFCDYFRYRDGAPGAADSGKKKAISALDDLFKK